MPRACLEVSVQDVQPYLRFVSELRRRIVERGGLVMPAGREPGWLLAALGNALLSLYLKGTMTPLTPDMLAGHSGIRACVVIDGGARDVVEAASIVYEAGAATGVKMHLVSEKQC